MTLRSMTSFAIFVCCLSQSLTLAAEKDSRVYEMRTYFAAPGKLDALQARFREHTAKLFEKHGMTNIGYWVPIKNPENKLIYILAFPDTKARTQSWKEFGADSEWQKVRKGTESGGSLVTKVDSVLMTATDYSPAIRPSANGERVFELRVYTASKGNLDNLNARFRNHTLKLFDKHGMTSMGYWVPVKGEKGSEDTLIYLLAHKSVEQAKASFDSFRKDPQWIEARKASEEKAGGSLTINDGIKSVFMKATDFSPIR
jgi:hypothetical protein